jgi:hypothetical protein
MAVFTKIEIHFRDPVAGARRAVILPNSRVQAVFLRGSENRLAFMEDVKQIIVDAPPEGVTLEGQVQPRTRSMGSSRGPGEVCYLINGVLHCWKPT